MKKKIILLFGLLLILSGCKKEETEEIECPEEKEKVLIKYNDIELTEDDVLKETKDYIFPVIFQKVKGDLLKLEMEDHIDDAETYTEDTMEELKEYYGDDLEPTIKYTTEYYSIEELEEAVFITYLEEEYVKNYIIEKEELNSKEFTTEDSYDYYQTYYTDALEELFEKYDVSFETSDYKKQYKEYIKDLEEYYSYYN